MLEGCIFENVNTRLVDIINLYRKHNLQLKDQVKRRNMQIKDLKKEVENFQKFIDDNELYAQFSAWEHRNDNARELQEAYKIKP